MRRKDRQMNTPELIAKGSAMVVGSGAWLGLPIFCLLLFIWIEVMLLRVRRRWLWWCGYCVLLLLTAFWLSLCLNRWVGPLLHRAEPPAKRNTEQATNYTNPRGAISGLALLGGKSSLPLIRRENGARAAGVLLRVPRRELLVAHAPQSFNIDIIECNVAKHLRHVGIVDVHIVSSLPNVRGQTTAPHASSKGEAS